MPVSVEAGARIIRPVYPVLPTVLPGNPALTFDQRWAAAALLPSAGMVAFIQGEIYRLNEIAGNGEQTIIEDGCFPSEGVYRRTLLTIDKKTLAKGSLPKPIKDYLLNPPYPEHSRWKNPKLWLDTVEGKIRRYQIILGTYLSEYVPHWISSDGRDASYDQLGIGGPSMTAEISPYYKFEDPTHPLHSSTSFRLYQELDGYIKENGIYALVRELVRFAGAVIETPAQSAA